MRLHGIPTNIQQRETRNGAPYVAFTMLLPGGKNIPAKMWNTPKEFEMPRDKVLAFEGNDEEYQGSTTFIVKSFEESDIPSTDFLPRSIIKPATMKKHIRDDTQSILDNGIRLMVEKVFKAGSVSERFYEAPGATAMHHAYVGGLSQHTHGVAHIAAEAGKMYDGMNRDIVMAGALLHDLGKIIEYEVKPGFPRTMSGRLEGHIRLGLQMIEVILGEELRPSLAHVILSHHGKLEWGSPVEPQTIEAVTVFQADYMDSRLAGCALAVKDLGLAEWTKSPVGVLGVKMLRL